MNINTVLREKILFVIFIFILLFTNSIGVFILLRTTQKTVSKSVPRNVPLPTAQPNPAESSNQTDTAALLPTETDIQKEKDNLEKLLTVKAALLGVSDNISLYFKDLSKNYEITIDPDSSWVPASTIKAFVLPEAFRQRDNGLINFDQKIIISSNNVVPTELETYAFPQLTEGTRITIRELLNMMITQSDNTAYNTLLDILDRRNINATLKKLGFLNTIVGEKLNLDDQQYQNDLQVHGYQQNRTSVHDFSLLFNGLYENKISDSPEMLALFKRQKVNYMIPALLPPDVPIAHKTGEFSPYYHDGGIVYKKGYPFIFVVFSSSDNPQIVSELARTAYFQDEGATSSIHRNLPLAENNPEALPRGIRNLGLNQEAGNILGVKTQKIQKILPFTAADYGITTDDIVITAQDTPVVQTATVFPGSTFYTFKRFWENITVFFEITQDQKIDFYLHQAATRISEIKSLLQNRNLQYLPDLLNDYEYSAKQALAVIQSTPEGINNLIFIKQLNELVFAVIDNETKGYTKAAKDSLINAVYGFYTVNRKEIGDFIKITGLSSPQKYTPIFGKITQKNDTTLKILLSNKQTFTVKLFLSTQVRSFHEKPTTDINALQVGNYIAVIGHLRGKTITPFFILNNIPSDFPKEVSGTLIAIDFDKQTLLLADSQGKQNTTAFDLQTHFQSKDTLVSPASIQLGSTLLIRGEQVGNTFRANTAYVLTNK